MLRLPNSLFSFSHQRHDVKASCLYFFAPIIPRPLRLASPANVSPPDRSRVASLPQNAVDMTSATNEGLNRITLSEGLTLNTDAFVKVYLLAKGTDLSTYTLKNDDLAWDSEKPITDEAAAKASADAWFAKLSDGQICIIKVVAAEDKAQEKNVTYYGFSIKGPVFPITYTEHATAKDVGTVDFVDVSGTTITSAANAAKLMVRAIAVKNYEPWLALVTYKEDGEDKTDRYAFTEEKSLTYAAHQVYGLSSVRLTVVAKLKLVSPASIS